MKDKPFLKNDEPYEASFYLAVITLDSVKDLFNAGHYIKSWLIECAGLVAD